MKFFNLSLHVSVISDVKKIFEDLGHQVDNWTLSDHGWVFGREKDDVDVINSKNWRSLDAKMCDDFYDRYKDELSKYDAFIVDHTPSFALLYQKFNKPIIVICSTRYEAPFSSDLSKWTWLNRYLSNGIAEGKIFLVANNKYDAKYFKWFTYEDCLEVIPSLCEYTNVRYKGVYDNCLLFSKFKCGLDSNLVVDKDIIFGGSPYSWEDLAKFKAIVHIPYNASTMSIFEQYTAGIPLIFPSWDFLKRMRAEYSSYGVLSELSWNQVRDLPSKSVLYCGPDEDDPNNYSNNETMMDWAKLSDFYDKVVMPEVVYFESLDHLYKIIEKHDFRAHSAAQLENVANRKDLIYSKWRAVLELVGEAL